MEAQQANDPPYSGTANLQSTAVFFFFPTEGQFNLSGLQNRLADFPAFWTFHLGMNRCNFRSTIDSSPFSAPQKLKPNGPSNLDKEAAGQSYGTDG
jgi:hypothetical protein